MDRRRSLLKIAALRSEREQQVGVNCTKGYLESTDAGLLFDGPRSMECFFNLRQSDGTQRPAQFSTSMLAIAVTPMDAIMFHCGDKSLQVSRVTIGDDIHAVISYDGATAMCYINGIEVGAMQPTAYTPSALFRIGDPLHITKSPVHFCRHFNYALSAEEVAALYNDGDPAGYIVPKSRRLQATPYIRLMAPMTTQSIPPTIVDGALAVTYPTETGQGYNNGIWRPLSVNVENECYFLLKFKAKADDDNTRIASFVGVGSGLPYYKHDVIASTSFTEYYAVFKNTRGVPMTSIGFYPIFNTSGNGKFYIKDVSVTFIGLIAEYLPQNIRIAQKRDFPQVVFPVAKYTPSSGVFNLNNSSAMIIKNDQPQADGFSGAYTRFDAITSISLYCAYISDFIKKQAPLKITFEYRSNRILYSSNITASPAASDAVAIDVNEGDAKIASVSCGVGATAFVFSASDPEAWLEMRVLSIEVAEGVAISWLDSAKQLPLNDEYLPPLLQSDGGYDLTASGTPEIIIK